MSSILRTPSSSFFGMPPIFFKRREAARVAKPAVRAADPRAVAQRAASPRTAAKPAAPAPAKNGVDFDKLLAATRKAPVDLAPIEWEGDLGVSESAGATVDATTTLDQDPRGADARNRRIRDRYIGARFPGVARGVSDLENPERVVKSARLYFEDGQIDSALELLDMAIEQNSRAQALWLAQLEILFLARDASRFVECARAFRALHPASEQWAEICRLGQALAPREGLFGDKSAARTHEHYGPWPDLPNWIQANWDLTAEVLAADFRRLLKRRAAEARGNSKPQLAA